MHKPKLVHHMHNPIIIMHIFLNMTQFAIMLWKSIHLTSGSLGLRIRDIAWLHHLGVLKIFTILLYQIYINPIVVYSLMKEVLFPASYSRLIINTWKHIALLLSLINLEYTEPYVRWGCETWLLVHNYTNNHTKNVKSIGISYFNVL